MQTKLQSMIEAWANILIGYGIAVAANYYVLPLFGFQASATDAAGIGLIFTAISLLRSYVLRRVFNKLHG